MHIPDHMLNGTICPVTAGVSAAAICGAVWIARKSKQPPSGMKFAAVTALVFAAQMLNFPIQHGTSGHLLGGVLLASLLGIPFGILAMALILTVQCLVFSDGGITVLGTNILNMGVLGVGLGGWLFQKLEKLWRDKSAGTFLALGAASWISVMLAALACSLELVLTNHMYAINIFSAMLGTHARIAVGETVMTALFYAVFSSHAVVKRKNTALFAGLGAFIGAVMLSPFASTYPDGLEWVARQYQLLHNQTPKFIGPLSDYAVSFIIDTHISTSLAGLTGVFLTAFLGLFLVKIMGLKAMKAKI